MQSEDKTQAPTPEQDAAPEEHMDVVMLGEETEASHEAVVVRGKRGRPFAISENLDPIPQAIHARMVELGLTARQLATVTQTAPDVISTWRRNKYSPRLSSLRDIMPALGLDIVVVDKGVDAVHPALKDRLRIAREREASRPVRKTPNPA